ncbi:MAG: translation initiation factor IF-2 [Gammaproteobacteria bacterium]|jgi:translation initiation factor IF-2
MSEKDNIKLKSDTLSSRKSTSSSGVHVKRKRRIVAKTSSSVNKPSINTEKKETSANEAAIKPKANKLKPSTQAQPIEAKTPKKHKVDKDEKIEKMENKELHLKHPNKKDKNKKITPKVQEIQSTHKFEKPTEPVVRDVKIKQSMTVAELAGQMALKNSDLIAKMMGLGVMATVNQSLDQDTAVLITEELGHKAIIIKESEDEIITTQKIKITEGKPRAPIVTIMGHVDHGKTSLLDYIRKSKITESESGGITQHIGAYKVKTNNGEIAFLDTPGHAAFTSMRARGAQVTDIVILVVSADDGVMPQTKEAIEHSKAAGVPMIIAINKIDKENADQEKVKNDLAANDVVPEDWGGDTIFVPISALTGEGVDNLLDSVVLQAEILELKANDQGPATGIVIESSLDKGKGPIATILIQNGILNQKDFILVGQTFGRVRALFNEFGKPIKSAGPSTPVVITGLSATPNVGDQLISTDDEKKVKDIASSRERKQKEIDMQSKQKNFSIESFGDASNNKKIINYLIKTDVQGSCEAIISSLQSIENPDVGLDIVYSGVGGITESDINLAVSAGAHVIGFNVRADSKAKKLVESHEIPLKYFSIIYDLIDNVKYDLSGELEPEIKEEIIGVATVKDVFRSSKLGAIAGSIVSEGTIQKDQPIRVLRDNTVIYEGELESLRRFKEDVKEVKSGTECGIGVKDYNDIKAGDQIEVYKRTEIKRSV